MTDAPGRGRRLGIYVEIEDPSGTLDETGLLLRAGPAMLTIAQIVSHGHPNGRTMVYYGDTDSWVWASFRRVMHPALDPEPQVDAPAGP